MNVIKDVIFEGRILNQVQQAVDYIKIQMKERTYLGKDAVFVTEEEYGEFVRTEIVVNAATHRDYAITGTDIQIKMFDDRLEVDSPGSFAGMVKKENIRYTHFSRNPKIAAFLKDYGFVKENGEGVDRMCRELNAIGLPDPVFDNNTFILKTTICSAAYEKLPIGQPKVTDSGEKLPIGQPKVTDSEEKLPIGEEKVTDSLQKLPFDDYKNACKKLGYSETSIENLNRVYDLIEVNQVFGSIYIMKELRCSERTSRNLLAKLRDMNVVVAVKGKGKGKYRFKYKTEM